MANFDPAIAKTLIHEGSELFVDKVNGEFSRYGVTLKFYRGAIDADAGEDVIRGMTEAKARQIYYNHFWAPLSLDRFTSQKVASKVFDLGVNMGTGTTARLLQRSLNDLGEHLEDDGRIGRRTLEAVNRNDEAAVYAALLRRAEERYRDVAKQPNKAKFLPGWLARLKADDAVEG